MVTFADSPWICCQLGAREHYAIPRALAQAGKLHSLVTDAWVGPQSVLHPVPGLRSLCDRYHPDLSNATIKAFTPSLMQFELAHKFRKTTPWNRMIARNDWFQKKAIAYLDTLKQDDSPILFSYSYAALDLFRYAKQRGWRTVLGQIDPGIAEEKIVAEESGKYPEVAPAWEPAPAEYWQRWQQECTLADQIIVNSSWSKQLLEQSGIDSAKIKIVPLVYTPAPAAQSFHRSYPDAFSTERPLRVLFLGQVTLRKGITAVIEAIRLLNGKPVEFWIVGPQDIQIPDDLLGNRQVRWIGAVPRSQVQAYYREADIFLFPTLSDGFGLTQLEAQAWKLPIIATKNCGKVVENHHNGRLLENTSASEICRILEDIVINPKAASGYSDRSSLPLSFGLSQLMVELNKVSEPISL